MRPRYPATSGAELRSYRAWVNYLEHNELGPNGPFFALGFNVSTYSHNGFAGVYKYEA